MNSGRLPKDFRKLLDSVEGKRPRTVIDHILKHGQITTEDLKEIYGYNHPPRAIRDVREQGIPLEMSRVTGSDGRRIAAYRFGDPSKARPDLSGRTVLSSKLKAALVEEHGARCNIYLEAFSERDLQIDHRVPFEIAGDDKSLTRDVNEYMLLCASANRAKSWSCKHCENWKLRDANICKSCYWAYPESYTHVAMQEIRRLDIIWADGEIAQYNQLRQQAKSEQEEAPEFVKRVLRLHFSNRKQ